MDDDLLKRFERLESMEAIRQLTYRYALAVDTRNLDDLVGLFVENVRIGKDKYGREALRESFTQTLSGFTTSVHLVGNHIIDFDDEDHARGVLYCHTEQEDGASWIIAALQYWDTYARRDGRWYFVRRKVLKWYESDLLDKPIGPLKRRWPGRPKTEAELPDAWASWKTFWQGMPGSPKA